jgi:uncharacterized protein YicC (UPF0701 family)
VATLQLSKKKSVEVKSLNSKGLDLNVRMPSLYQNGIGFTQSNCTIGKRKSRFSIFYRKYAEQTSTKVNVPIVKAWIKLKLREGYWNRINGGSNADTMKIERDEIDENDWVQIKPLSKKRCKTS